MSDRAKALNFWAMERRQIRFAHLLRKFIMVPSNNLAERDQAGRHRSQGLAFLRQ